MRIVDEQGDRLLAASGVVAPETSASRTRRSASLVSFLWSDKEGELAVISTLVSYDPAVDRSNRSCFRTESSPNVEYGKMRSELNECALGVDLRGIHSAFYFY
jgi:hypothetical protein